MTSAEVRGWAWTMLALPALLIVAEETRYVARPGTPAGPSVVWDRLGHRFCMIQPEHGWLCRVRIP